MKNRHHDSHSKRPSYLAVASLALAVCALGILSLRQYRLIEELRENQVDSRVVLTQVGRIGALDRHSVDLEAKTHTIGDSLDVLQQHVDSRIRQTESQLHELGQYVTTRADEQESQIIRDLSGRVCLIQGQYVFVNPENWQPLRYDEPISRSEPSSPIEPAAVTVSTEGVGDILAVTFSGTGFLIHAGGYIATNRHVIEPWTTDKTYQHCINAGYRPQLKLLRAFFPDLRKPVALTPCKLSADEDLAIARCEENPGLEPLTLSAEGGLKPGQTLLIMGYPRGLDLMAARWLKSGGGAEMDGLGGQAMQVAENLARLQLIAPVATRGMCGQVTDTRVLYDAATAQGASGSPVIDKSGQVVAVNAALIREFSGTGFGIPAEKVRALLEACLKP